MFPNMVSNEFKEQVLLLSDAIEVARYRNFSCFVSCLRMGKI